MSYNKKYYIKRKLNKELKALERLINLKKTTNDETFDELTKAKIVEIKGLVKELSQYHLFQDDIDDIAKVYDELERVKQ